MFAKRTSGKPAKKSAKQSAAYEKHKSRMRDKSAAESARAREIGDIPPPGNKKRHEACRRDFRLYCETYHSATFNLSWSPDHIKVIRKIEHSILDGGLFAVAMPRGSGKTSLCECAALWALLYGHRRFVVLVSADSEASAKSLKSLRIELETNDELFADFPSATLPLRRLDGIHQRRLMFQGRTLRQEITRTDLVLADVPGDSCEGRVRCVGITSSMRGMVAALGDGKRIRPDMVIVDDPQTDESARSPSQVEARESIIHGTILGLAGPKTAIAAIAPVTVIRQDDLADRLLSTDLHPDWQGERCKMVYEWPSSEEAKKLWEQYREIRLDSLRSGKGVSLATEFVRQNYDAMHAGAVVAWPDRFRPDECSALQSAYNLRLRNEEAFLSEYQNDPKPDNLGVDAGATAADFAGKINGRERGVCPINVQHVTGMIDVQQDALYYAVVGWEPNFTGYVLDYGAYPEQGEQYFAYADLRVKLSKLNAGGKESSIHAGLTNLTTDLLARQWRREDGAQLRIERLQIDANFESDTIYGFCAGSRHGQLLLPSHGKYVGARSAPFSEYKRRQGDLLGHNWRMPNVAGRRAVRYVLFDSNYWKSFVYSRFATPIGGGGSLSLWGHDPTRHRMISEHLTAEYRTRTTGRGRECDEWQQRPGRPDNHLFDCVVGAAVAVSVSGVELGGVGVSDRKHRDWSQARPTLDQLRKGR